MADPMTAWGSDARVSMPEPIDPADVVIDFGSHVLTPDGLRLNVSRAVRDEIVSFAYLPVDVGE